MKKPMKRLLALIVAAMMLFGLVSLAACAKETPPTDSDTTETTPPPADDTDDATPPPADTDTEEPSGDVSLVLGGIGKDEAFFESARNTWKDDDNYDPNHELSGEFGAQYQVLYYDATVKAIKAAYPDYKIEFVDWGWAEALDQKQRAAITAGNAPDTLFGEQFMPTYVNTGVLAPIPDDIVDQLTPSMLIYNAEGKACAFAQCGSLFVLFYNKKLLRDAGVDADKPVTTWDEWLAAADAVTAKGDGKIFGGGIPCYPHVGGMFRVISFIRQLGIDIGSGSTIQMDTPEMVQAMEFIRKMNKNMPAGLSTNNDEGPTYTSFVDDQTTAFNLNGGWVEGMWEAKGYSMDDLGICALPLPEGGNPGNCIVGAVYVGVNAASKNPDAAFNAIRAILTPDCMKYWLMDRRAVPLKSMLADIDQYTTSPVVKQMVVDLTGGQYTPLPVFDKNDSQIYDVFNVEVLGKVDATTDPIADICKDAQAKMENLLK